MNTSLTRCTTDNEIILSWLSSKKSPITQKRYSTNIHQFRKFIGDNSLSDLKVEDIQDFLKMLTFKGYKPNTIAQKLMTVKSLFAYAVKVGYLTLNPTVMVTSVPIHSEISQKLLTSADIKLLVNNAKCQRDKLIIKTLFSLGLRISELVKLQWSDIFFLPNGVKKMRVTGKGNKIRELVITDRLYSELLTIKEDNNPFIFHAYLRQAPLKANSVWYLLKKIVDKSGLNEKISPHWLRHSHATEAIANGCDLSLLQQSMGHSSITTTQKYLCYRDTEGSSNFIDI